jgi:hypothetical protein
MKINLIKYKCKYLINQNKKVFVFVFFYDLYLLIYVINNSWKISKKIKIDKKFFISYTNIYI